MLYMSMVTGVAYSKDWHISIIDYQDVEQLLSVNIVAPPEGEDKLYLSADGIVSELRRFTRVGEHKLVIHLPCSEFKNSDYLLYKAGDITLTLSLERVSCTSDNAQLQQPRIIYSNAGCIIEPKGTTLWRVGSLLAEKNGYSVYQNMYSVFLSNRHHFVDEDITRMQDSLLLCPPEEIIASIDKRHAVEMFQDAEAFRLASNMQKVATPNNEQAHSMEQAEGSELLAQVTARAAAVSAEIAPVEEVTGQEADAGLLAMASAAMDVADNGQPADAYAGADVKSEDGELLAQVTSPADVVVEMTADSEPLAIATAAMDVADNGQPADANTEADVKSEGGELLAQVTSPADAVSADAVVEMAADSEHLAMASAAMRAGDKAASAGADVKSEGSELLAQVTALSEVVAEQEVDAELLAMSQHEGDGEQPLGLFTAPAEVAKQEHPIVDATLAVISGGDKDVVPKLVIAIDGGKQAGHLNVVPGCYIEPNNKTLWRIGLALNKLNGHTVYQNMYAVFAVNPKAFPSGNVNHMLNQKLRCPTAREVTKHTTKESKALMELDLPG